MAKHTLNVPVKWMQSLAALGLPKSRERRLQALMERDTSGQLGAQERAELDSLVELAGALARVSGEAATQTRCRENRLRSWRSEGLFFAPETLRVPRGSLKLA